MDNPFSWDYLTTTPGSNEVFGPFAIGFLVIFLTGFIISFVAYAGWAEKSIKHPVVRRMIQRWAGWALSLFAVGLFFFLIRILQINPFTFGMRIWLFLCLIALAAFCLWLIIDYRRIAPEVYKQAADRQQMKEVVVTLKGAKGSSTTAAVPVGGRPVKRNRR
jgi:FtsH-binding integral membrane protein